MSWLVELRLDSVALLNDLSSVLTLPKNDVYVVEVSKPRVCLRVYNICPASRLVKFTHEIGQSGRNTRLLVAISNLGPPLHYLTTTYERSRHRKFTFTRSLGRGHLMQLHV